MPTSSSADRSAASGRLAKKSCSTGAATKGSLNALKAVAMKAAGSARIRLVSKATRSSPGGRASRQSPSQRARSGMLSPAPARNVPPCGSATRSWLWMQTPAPTLPASASVTGPAAKMPSAALQRRVGTSAATLAPPISQSRRPTSRKR